MIGIETRPKEMVAEDVARALGRSWAAWHALVGWLSEHYAPLSEEWKFAGAQWGWSLRAKRRKRTIVYLLPCRKYFRVTLILGDKAVNLLRQSGLPQPISTEIRQAKRYPEGRVVRFTIRFKNQLPPIMQLVEAKMST